jgi:hypothetical protein
MNDVVDIAAVAVVVVLAIGFLVSRFVGRRASSKAAPVVVGDAFGAALKKAQAKRKASS